jgi:secreted PhoX family phosphatase
MIDQSEDFSVNPRAKSAPTIGDVIKARLSRRGFLAGTAAAGAVGVTGCSQAVEQAAETITENAASVSFTEITRDVTDTIAYPEGYSADLVIRWGDALFNDSPAFDPENQSPAAQERQFGYNNDYIGFIEMERIEGRVTRGILCVNHEYTNTVLMFPGVAADLSRPP